MKLLNVLFAAVLMLAPDLAIAKPQTTTQPMSFAQCKATVAATIKQIRAEGQAAKNIKRIVNTNIMTMTKICTQDGSVILSCSQPDQKLAITRSPHKC